MPKKYRRDFKDGFVKRFNRYSRPVRCFFKQNLGRKGCEIGWQLSKSVLTIYKRPLKFKSHSGQTKRVIEPNCQKLISVLYRTKKRHQNFLKKDRIGRVEPGRTIAADSCLL